MTKQEFEQLAGYEVSADSYYDIIEPMYMATDLDKREFVKCVSEKAFALKPKKELISEARKIAEQYKKEVTAVWQEALEEQLEKIRKEIKDRYYSMGFLVFINWAHKKLADGNILTYPESIEIYNRFSGISVYYNLA